MSLKEDLEARGVTRRTMEIAVANTSKVLAQVIMNSSKNVTNAQAMKGNASMLAEDLKVMKAALEEFVAADEAAVKAARKPRKPTEAEEEVSKADES